MHRHIYIYPQGHLLTPSSGILNSFGIFIVPLSTSHFPFLSSPQKIFHLLIVNNKGYL